VKSVSAVKWIEAAVAADTATDGNALKSPSVFGRLVSVALRSEELVTPQHGKDDSIWADGCAQREAHRAAFGQWLNLSLAQQWADLEVYAAWSSSDLKALLRQWLSSERLQRLLPQDVLEAERALFLGDLDVLRQLSGERSGSGARRGFPDWLSAVCHSVLARKVKFFAIPATSQEYDP